MVIFNAKVQVPTFSNLTDIDIRKIMDAKQLIANAITLLYRESQLSNMNENSASSVRYLIDKLGIVDNNISNMQNKSVLLNLKNTALAMCKNPVNHKYDKQLLLQTLQLNCDNDEYFFDIISQGIMPDYDEDKIKSIVITLRKSIDNYFREQKANEALSKAAHQLKFKPETIKNFNDFITDVISQLEGLQVQLDENDPAIFDNIDFAQKSTIDNVYSDIVKANSTEGLLKFGWQELNEMTQGGARRGDTVAVYGLPHRNKTGFTLSLFRQFAKYNIPDVAEGKKPLLLRISYEDHARVNAQSLYTQIKWNNESKVTTKDDWMNITSKDLYETLHTEFGANGWCTKIMRIDPTEHGYKDIINLCLKLESEGYEIVVLMVDYLCKATTKGCNQNGPIGTDKREMWRRIRNFSASRNMLFVSPHQISTEAKNVLRSGISDEKFLEEIQDKGYLEGCKQLDQEVDLELYIHTWFDKKTKRSFFKIRRGKHRLTTIFDEIYRELLFLYPDNGMMIPDDYGKEIVSKRKISDFNIVSRSDYADIDI